MKRVQFIIAACALACAPAGASRAMAEILRNGGFEQGVFGDGSVRQILPGDSTLPGWTVGGGPISWYRSGFNLGGNALSPHTGDFAVNLADGSVRSVGVSQTIALLPFIEQQVSYWVGN